jgi:hypothetical protein
VNKKLRKYKLKYDYLQIEKEEIDEEFIVYKKQFDDIFNKYFNKPEVKEVWVNENTGEVVEEEPTTDAMDFVVKEPVEHKSNSIKKLYKSLSKKTHPDWGGDTEKFQRISRAYTESNLIELIYYAGEYELDIEIDPLDEEILDNNLRDIEKELDTLRNTLVWVWNTGTKEAKVGIIKQIEDLTGHLIMDDVEDLL